MSSKFEALIFYYICRQKKHGMTHIVKKFFNAILNDQLCFLEVTLVAASPPQRGRAIPTQGEEPLSEITRPFCVGIAASWGVLSH